MLLFDEKQPVLLPLYTLCMTFHNGDYYILNKNPMYKTLLHRIPYMVYDVFYSLIRNHYFYFFIDLIIA